LEGSFQRLDHLLDELKTAEIKTGEPKTSGKKYKRSKQ
jgi:hypothetical protein